jgi:hypothetical protein
VPYYELRGKKEWKGKIVNVKLIVHLNNDFNFGSN